MLDRFKIFGKKETTAPKHVAITIKGCFIWSQKNKEELQKSYEKRNAIIKQILEQQIKLNIPITTFLMLSTKSERTEYYNALIDSLADFFNKLSNDDIIHSNKIRVSILGKWYALPGNLVDSIKNITEQTKDYDGFFLNFCINYNGQDEILDAFKLISNKILSKELEIDDITKDIVKDNLYSSYFIPPEIIIETGLKTTFSGVLLWDSPKAIVLFTKKLFPDFTVSDFLDAVKKD